MKMIMMNTNMVDMNMTIDMTYKEINMDQNDHEYDRQGHSHG